VGGTTNLHNLSNPALQQSWSATPGPSTEDVSCSLTNTYNKPLSGTYMEFPMKMLTDGYYYTVSNGTFGQTYDVSGQVRMNQVYTDLTAGQSNKLVRVRKSTSADTTTPTGSVLINDGAASTDIADVTLTLNAVDIESGVGEMMVSNDSGFSGAAWEPYNTTMPWTLSDGTGTKTVYVKYRDRAMPAHEVTKTDTIMFNAPPSNARITTVSPNTSNRGLSFAVDIHGVNTHFVQGTTNAVFSKGGSTSGFDVYDTTVHSSTYMSADVHIPLAPTGRLGSWDVGATNGAEQVMPLEGGFTVTGPAITAVDPPEGTVGTNMSVNITGSGTNFVQDNHTFAHFKRDGVDVSGIVVNTTMITNTTHCTANITIGYNVDIGQCDVSVITWGDEYTPLQNSFDVVQHVPLIRSVTPQSAVRGDTLDVDIVGADTAFAQGTSVASFGAGITVNTLTVSDARHARANITISPSATAGARNVNVVTNPQTPSPLIAGFTVEYPGPTVVYIAPNTAANSGPVNISDLDGTGFRAGATVKLTKSGEADIPGTSVVVVNQSRITCTFNLTG